MTQYLDSRGHGLTTSSAAAADAFNAGMHGFVCWRTDTMDHLDAAMAADPDFALPKLAKGWILQTARSAAFHPLINDLLADAAPLMEAASGREQAYFHGLTAAVGGHGVAAATVMEAMLADHPTDLLGHRLVQFELFWNGRAAWMREMVERAAPAWNKDLVDHGCFLSARSFANEEAGDYELAERCGRQAVEIDPTDCWGTHAVAHVHAMQGRVDDGVAWLEGLNGNWGEANQIAHHLWWHLCIMLLEQGAHDRILALVTAQIRNPESPLVKAMPGAPIDLQNVASLLMRLQLRGVDLGDHWNVFAEICAGRITDHGSPFSAAHDMLVLTGSGQFDLADQLLQNMRAFAATGDGTLVTAYRAVGIPLCEAILAYRRGEYERAVALLSPIRHDLQLIGGSHAQRDLFYQIMLDAAHRAGRKDLIPLYFDDIRRIGFDKVEQRTLYRDMAA
jgi:tetratricopeptide (TPR) repeat protein|tara:strand:- start:2759 stop:4105 length:1347 start_codon:yes stop_codon:yes gene_type:complete